MEKVILECIKAIKMGDPQVHKHVTIIPLFKANGTGPDYLTMKEAMENHLLTIGEMTESGSVPELKVKNQALKSVLLVDGEELAGAKQNRVLNTTILIRETSETVIPVSCTEHGRWSFVSSCFEESGHMMSACLRRVKNESVHENLKRERKFVSNQGAVWDEISDFAIRNKVTPVTGAMKDVIDAKKEDLDEYLERLPYVEKQNGLLVLVNGRVVGLDLVSRATAFRLLHSKLVRSYVMDALTELPKKTKAVAGDKTGAFLEEIQQCQEQQFESVGYGVDCRYEGKKIVGSVLLHENTVVHMAFFSISRSEKVGHMSSSLRRRAFRTT